MKVSPHAPGSLRSLPLSSIISRPVAIGYDVLEDRVYWTDVTRNTISRSFLNGTMFEVLFYQNVQSPDGLAVDIVGRNLYWTDTGTNKLEVSKLDGSYRKALITSGLDEPRDIILDVSKGSVHFESICKETKPFVTFGDILLITIQVRKDKPFFFCEYSTPTPAAEAYLTTVVEAINDLDYLSINSFIHSFIYFAVTTYEYNNNIQ